MTRILLLLWIASTAHLLPAAAHASPPPNGPDVSSHQHPRGGFINWFMVRGSGHEFAMVKATEGLNYVNPYFIPDSLMMRTAGVSRGVYHYADPSQSPELQAAFFATMVLGENGPLDLPPVLDLEKSGGLPPQALIGWTHRYLNAVRSLTGRQPIIYTYPRFWRTAMADSREFTTYPLWIADYSGGPGPKFPLPGGWPMWTFWQRTDCGSVPGIPGCVDINLYSGAQGDFNTYSNRMWSGS